MWNLSTYLIKIASCMILILRIAVSSLCGLVKHWMSSRLWGTWDPIRLYFDLRLHLYAVFPRIGSCVAFDGGQFLICSRISDRFKTIFSTVVPCNAPSPLVLALTAHTLFKCWISFCLLALHAAIKWKYAGEHLCIGSVPMLFDLGCDVVLEFVHRDDIFMDLRRVDYERRSPWWKKKLASFVVSRISKSF